MSKPIRPLEEVESDICSLTLKEGEWRVGIRSVNDYWAVILNIDVLPYDVQVKGVYSCMEEAYRSATDLAFALGGKEDHKTSN